MKKESFNAWAIDTNSIEGHGLVGRYWWFFNKAPDIPEQYHGLKVCLFKTRASARKYLKYMKNKKLYIPFPRAKVVKVEVNIEIKN